MLATIKYLWSLLGKLLRARSWGARLFVLTGAIFLLQLFPLTGVFLMLLAAPFWSVLTLNLAFILLALEALIGRVDRRWILAPLAWFLGYWAYASATHERYLAVNSELRRQNAEQTVAFDPSRQSLVVRENAADLAGFASHVVREYGVPVAYEARPSDKRQPFASYRIAGKDLCAQIREDHGLVSSGIQASWFHTGQGSDRKLVRDLCMLTLPEGPPLPQLVLQGSTEQRDEWLLPHSLTRISILDPLGNTVRVTSGRASILGWIPMPVMGCALNSGAPAWECFYGFWREDVGLGGEGAFGAATRDVTARTLGLVKKPPDQLEPDTRSAELALQAALEGRVAQDLAVLDEVIAEGKRRIIIFDVSSLLARPERALTRGEAMAGAIARALAAGQSMYETARVMEGILARFPAADFQSLAPPLVPILVPLVEKKDWVVDRHFATRLGDLGPVAVPLLERLAFGGQRPDAQAILGLCRAGPAAAHLAEDIAAKTAGKEGRRNDDLDTAAYVTLLRMGRRDIVDRETAAGRFARVEKPVVERNVTPESPRSVCTGDGGQPQLPD